MHNVAVQQQSQSLEPPLRGEPFSADHLWSHADELASRQRASVRRGDARRFVERFDANSRFVSATFRSIAACVRQGEPVTPAAEWVLDNFHIIEEQLREVRDDLPRGYYRELPKLETGEWVGFPRVYELAHELVVHTDSSVTHDLIAGFIEAYQRVSPLTTGEIWAVPIMLRLVLIENLRRLCGHILAARNTRRRASELLDGWQRSGRPDPELSVESSRFPLLVMHLFDSLRGAPQEQGNPSLAELVGHLGREPDALDEVVRKEQQRLAADQVSMGNIITSMQLLSGIDWQEFFERVSLVEHVLRRDPARVYECMDFSSRDLYRHEIETIAKRCRIEETRVAAAAVELALEAERRETTDARSRHVGCYLIGEGRDELDRRLHDRPRPMEWLPRIMQRHPGPVFFGGLAVGSLILTGAVFRLLAAQGAMGAAVVAAILALVPASELALGLVTALITNMLRPRALPKVEFKDYLPAHARTLVVIPTLLTSEPGVRALLEKLEIHRLANPEEGFEFALLTDFADAPAAETPSDARLLELARAGIRALNARYESEGERFHLLHRPRRWNPAQQTWMGWERKRGKLVELNRLLRGSAETTYLDSAAHAKRLAGIQYVITLDTDTRIPHGAAKKLVGAIVHPLNQAVIDRDRGRVTQGYGLLQPRVSVSLASAHRTLFARLYANRPGLDPYCTAVSDLYQDLFGEGSYMGKGIYDVDAFAAVIDDAFPEDQVLSHDLIEGCFARVGMVSDIELFDEFPTRYDADARRQHRWVRGDWQILPWLATHVPTASRPRKNPLSFLSRWKIVDNLRRSLVLPSLYLFLLCGWFLFPGGAWLATLGALAVVASPLFAQTLSALISWPRGVDWGQHVRDVLRESGRTMLQCGLTLAFIPHRALLMCDAIVRTLYRMFVTRRRLLDWETADATQRRLEMNPWHSLREMGWTSLMAIVLVPLLPAPSVAAALPVLIAWFVAPVLSALISRPLPSRIGAIDEDDRAMLRRVARRTWAFFENFVGPADHWLPPDNFQEYPKEKVAHRVSPTNAGLFIVSALAAHDFGYLGTADLAALLERNLESLELLDRYRGHIYNWYDTQTLEPLSPRYVSTADSGNFLASLLTAAQGLADVVRRPLLSGRLEDGIADTVLMVEETLARFQPRGARLGGQALADFEHCLRDVRGDGARQPRSAFARWERFEHLRGSARELTRRLEDYEKAVGVGVPELAKKTRLLAAQLEGIGCDADRFLGWMQIVAADADSAPGITGAQSADSAPHVGWSVADPEWQSAWCELWAVLSRPPSLAAMASEDDQLGRLLNRLRAAHRVRSSQAQPGDPRRERFEAFAAAVCECRGRAAECLRRFERLRRRYEDLAADMDFTLLYNPQRRLFSVGYSQDEGRLDRAHYDLLASESRLASLVAVAKGDVEHRHWFQLGRAVTEAGGSKTLLSWGGTMFEYLMPTLFLRDFDGSLLDQSCRGAVRRQIAWGRECGIPWGMSESAFAAQAVNSDYHYQSFGVPGLGLKRGLARDLVVSPYSTALATQIDPLAAVRNFRELIREGALGEWGLYDALDYTSSRVPPGERRVIVFCYMAHHHGMSLVALANCLFDHCMQRRFQSQPLIRATDLLIQERVPIAVLQFQPQADEAAPAPALPELPGAVSRRLSTAATSAPRTHLLSNGQYSVMLTNSGAGFSCCRSLAVTRWRRDPTRDDWGQFIYLRDLNQRRTWSAGFQPTRAAADSYEVTYSADKIEIRRRDGNLETHLQVAVSPEHNCEVRQVTLRNHGRDPAAVEVTSFAEVALAPSAADVAHPAFSKLFIETEHLVASRAVLARRRPRDVTQRPVWAIHVIALPEGADPAVDFETDRARFLGRGRTPAAPAALADGSRLSGTFGAVLDPIFSLRCRSQIAPGGSTNLAFSTAFADSREEALLLAEQFGDLRVVQRTFELAWADSQVELNRMKVPPSKLQLFQRLAAAVLYPDPAWRAAENVLKANTLGRSSLWRHGISGDDPIVLVQIALPEHRGLLRDVLLAHEFWHLHGARSDLVVLNEHPGGYFDEFHEQLRELVQTTVHTPLSKPGGVYLLRAAQTSSADRILLQASAAVCLTGERGSLARHIELSLERSREDRYPPFRPAREAAKPPQAATHPESRLPLQFANSYGGFSPDGRTFNIRLLRGRSTPAPWSNVIANPEFGFLVTESGGGYTWAGNSRENKLTSWSNDPVADGPGEPIYLRDEETGETWSPTALPFRDDSDYTIEHGRGFSRFLHASCGIESELILSIAPRQRVKFACFKLRNAGNRPRKLSATYYAEWVLGVDREQTQMQVITEIDERTGALLARNPAHQDTPSQVAFLHVLGGAASVTGNRTEFLGRNGSLTAPAGLRAERLSGTTGAGLDPCGAVQAITTLPPGGSSEIVFLLGQGADRTGADALLRQFGTPEQVHAALDETIAFWDETLSVLSVRTPDPALDLALNGWLLYQALSCRIWGRSAFYQSGGAFGFRDQLQDVMALVYARPEIAREHILRAAARQFEEGDVQHWWHPPLGRGVRTRFSDDLLWLPLATAHYVAVTGDLSILDERRPYLRSAPLEPNEEERYEIPAPSDLSEDLLAHCVRAVERARRFGPHRLPLMGTGDWNDGMNKVGALGQGESVWMAWFLIVVLRRMVPLLESRGEFRMAIDYRSQADALLQTAEEHAWDGRWYLRAFFDDGTPLGSAGNDECRIDSLAQSWAAIAGANAERVRQALDSVDEHLVREHDSLVLLFSPPFDKTPLDPGYIKGYLPGVRENGGQYTHAALWVVLANALSGRGARAVQLFDMLNPILLSAAGERAETYCTEPYAVAADVYSQPPHAGRGGWTWYTGSAAWMYRVALEAILGFQLGGDRLRFAPCIPTGWPGYELTFRRGRTSWHIRVDNPHGLERGISQIKLDGKEIDVEEIFLVDDGVQHTIHVVLVPGGQESRLESSGAVRSRVRQKS